MSLTDRLRNAWDAFQQREPPITDLGPTEIGYHHISGKIGYVVDSKRAMLASIWNRIAVDCSMIRLEHVRKDNAGHYTETIKSGLNEVLTLDANIDQNARAFIQDIVMSMFDEGVVAVVPRHTTVNPETTTGYDILTMRVGRIVSWHPRHVIVEVFDEEVMRRRQVRYMKDNVAILENPFFAIMNEPNSTLQRLNRTLNNLDKLDRKQAATSLDMIIKLPYSLKGEARKQEAERRRTLLEEQMRSGHEYNIGYIDATEDIIQLSKPLENNLVKQAEDLFNQLFNQVGMPKSIFDGTASDAEKVTYYNNTISPVLTTIAQEFTRKFLSRKARTQGQMIDYYQNVFKLIPVTKVAEIVDKFTRNEILSPNEVRMELGYIPSDDPKANELRNRNLNEKNDGLGGVLDPAVLAQLQAQGQEVPPMGEEGYDPAYDEGYDQGYEEMPEQNGQW